MKGIHGVKRAQYRDIPSPNPHGHVDHEWGCDGSGLRVEPSIVPS
ncbi:hypothetical protein BBCT_0940 [Bifidobacterium catenulatum DSM 16992 = JCM 1194 = LMG 11043]|uniref:Uncharacterized protein n=1 Tax=Bifidobacterium catenulatum DSM 16992 = JCM 1194 = LMG 11043 TaxID=566552 RepID=A0ABN5V1Q0_9BIFI|nr:hypothetical protein BBCT_0940 [Bifidobacterium catenulatum DSM 16992 = JCM 1194 = LMG 11043]